MSAPLVKGLIIGTSILLAAGLAIYESEQFRSWFDAQRRRILVTLESLAQNGASPETQQRAAQEMETELREEVVKRHRRDIINRAREEGVAVDLDELDAVESIYDAQQALLDEAAKNKQDRDALQGRRPVRRGTAQSFDDLVGRDGRLKHSAVTTGADQDNVSGIRQRGVNNGFAQGAAFGANPFDDENAMLFDQELIGAGGEELATLNQSSSAGVRSRSSTTRNIQVHDATSSDNHTESPYKTDEELNAEIEEAIRRSLENTPVTEQRPLIVVDDSPDAVPQMFQMPSSTSSSTLLHTQPQEADETYSNAQSMQGSVYESYYYGGPPQSATASAASVQEMDQLFHSAVTDKLTALTNLPQASAQVPTASSVASSVTVDADADDDWDSDDALTPAGTLTPAFSMADDMSMTDGVISPIRSRTLSLAHSEAGESVAMSDFSDLGDGIHTPASWTDVESVSGEEDQEQSSRPRGIRRVPVQ